MYRLTRLNIERVVEDEHACDILISQGYELVVEQQATNEVPVLDNLTVEELKELAKQKGLEGISKMKKEELIEALKGGE